MDDRMWWLVTGVLLLSNLGQLALLVLSAVLARKAAQDHALELERVMLLDKSTSLEQYAAVEQKVQASRLEDHRLRVKQGAVEGTGAVARKAPRVLDSIWRRRPTVVPQPKE